MPIKCKVDGCDAVFETKEPLALNATFVCRKHAGVDTKNTVYFQNEQFDKDLRRSGKPVGTSHIHRQGNDTDELARQQEIELKSKGLIK